MSDGEIIARAFVKMWILWLPVLIGIVYTIYSEREDEKNGR